MSEKVLIIDDEKDFLDIIAERIRAHGINVSTAASVEDALNMVEEKSFDVVIMDFMMPGMNGFQTIKAIKAKKPGVKIIILTGYVPDDQSSEARVLGVLDVIEKPPDLKELIGKIRNVRSPKRIQQRKGSRKK